MASSFELDSVAELDSIAELGSSGVCHVHQQSLRLIALLSLRLSFWGSSGFVSSLFHHKLSLGLSYRGGVGRWCQILLAGCRVNSTRVVGMGCIGCIKWFGAKARKQRHFWCKWQVAVHGIEESEPGNRTYRL